MITVEVTYTFSDFSSENTISIPVREIYYYYLI